MPSVALNGRCWLFGLFFSGLLIVAASPLVRAQEESTTEPKPRDGGWKQLHDSFLARAKQKEGVNLLFLGDSITQGWNGPQQVWERYYRPRNVANFGIGGDRTQHVLWRIENGEVDGIHPKVVVLMIGTNNMGANSADEIADGIKAIVKKLHEKLPETKVLLLGVFPRGERPDDPVRDKVKAVNEKIAKLDDGGKSVKYLDIGPRFMSEDGTISTAIMPDFLHLTQKGYRVWADAMEPTLWSMLDEKK